MVASVQMTSFGAAAILICELGRDCHARGWALGTSGNFSAVLEREPLCLAITPSGADKGALKPEQILAVDHNGSVVGGHGRSSAETELHLTLIRRGAGAVAHTHSIWSTLLSDAYAQEGKLDIEGYEMLKGLTGVRTHEHREELPIIENTQDWRRGMRPVEELLDRHPACHGFMIRRHGLYTWGRGVAEARRHVEILEFLLEVVGRQIWRS